LSYKTVKISYMVWILNETPRPMVWKLVKETPCLSKSVALYDLSGSFRGRINCLKLNETKNPVLEEFETFLNREYGIKLKPFFNTRISLETEPILEV
jgi:hypothetical protein